VRLALFIVLSYSVVVRADTSVRVLLNESSKPVELASISPIEVSTEKENLFLDHPRMNLLLSFSGGEWTIDVTSKAGKEQFHIRGRTLIFKSIEMQWRDHRLDFPVSVIYARGKYNLVGTMGLNVYLRGVVEHEMPASWPLEALKAQVVASRTYALWKKRQQHNDIYDLRPSILDQVFRLPKKYESNSLPPKVEKALQETEDIFLVDKRQRVLKTYFHSDCGGATDSASEIWGQGSAHPPARDVACAKRSSEWVSRWPATLLRARLMREFVLPSDLQLIDVVVRGQLQSQRVESVDLIFSKGIFKRVRGEDVRRILGYDKIRSTMFAISKENQAWTFRGRGFGHGVGMCQWGARSMAKSGRTYKEILAHYYPGSVLKDGRQAGEPSLVSYNIEPEFDRTVSTLHSTN